MTRYFSSRVRSCGYRDARLFVVATEGLNTEPQYFNELAKYYRNPRIRVLFIPPKDNKTSPKHVLDNLKDFSKKNHLKNDDEKWIVIDRDYWTEKELSDVRTKSNQFGIRLAVSNPCFEIWLLLHLVDINKYPKDRLHRFCTGHSSNGRKELEKEIRSICGSYNKSNIDTSRFIPNVDKAIKQAEILDNCNPSYGYPKEIGSGVYQLARELTTSI